MKRTAALAPLALLVAGSVLLTAGCGGKSAGAASASGDSGKSVAVKASDKSCEVATDKVAAGRQTFAVSNKGSDITEVYVYASGDRVMGEVENIGPSTKRNLTVDLVPGQYQVACKPGMVGNGIRSALTVTGTAPSTQPLSAQLTTAVADYRSYVATEVAALVTTTEPFVAAVKAGDVAKAKLLYAAPRTHYERIEPIAESFGDLDPLIDERIDDVTSGQPFVGFHRLEQDLYQKGDISKDGTIADQLLANTKKLQAQIPQVSITPLTMANGAKSLLDEVAKSKVTGEEERYSHLDLTDFAANVDGSKYAYTELRPVLLTENPALAKTLDTRFASIGTALAAHASSATDAVKTGVPYVLYTTLTQDQVKALAVEVDALSEPLGQLAAALPTA
jgi:iron uptake system component EfeO